MTVKNNSGDGAPGSFAEFSNRGCDYDVTADFTEQERTDGNKRDWRIYCAYAESAILTKYAPSRRRPWSISKLPQLADVLGPWQRRGVSSIDLPSLIKVDEWCECEAQLRERSGTLSEDEARDVKAEIAWLEAQLADCPAETVFGVIAKMMVWRRKNARMLCAQSATGVRHALAFSAYADLIRLTGLFALATEADREMSDKLLFPC
jgi:hypothetical protein